MTKDRLVQVLWGERPPRDHTATLESYVSVLRRRLQPGTPPRGCAVRTVPGGYLLDPDLARTDLDLFDCLVAEADRTDRDSARRLLDRASELGSAELLGSSGDTAWAEPVRSDYRQRALRAALRAADLALRDGTAEAATRLAQRALAIDQLCEPAWRLLMLASEASGQRDAGVRAYRACCRLLADELGIDPAPETQAALIQVVHGRRGPAPSDDLGSVLAAALDLFEHSTRAPVSGGATSSRVVHAAQVMAGLLRGAGVNGT